MDNWLALIIGNSRLHWAWFVDGDLVFIWDSQHLSIEIKDGKTLNAIIPEKLSISWKNKDLLPIYLASVVSQQTALWQNYPFIYEIKLKDIEIERLYPTIGIDRALAVWGAGNIYGYPCLVIDGGTALTLTGVDNYQRLIGGAILPGLRLQLTGLAQKTAALPEIKLDRTLPQRWALNTPEAIASGIIYSTIAGIYDFIIDWCDRFSNSSIVFTGGDGELLYNYFSWRYPQIGLEIKFDRNLIFYGIRLAKQGK
jgi:type III pantothenate kinase